MTPQELKNSILQQAIQGRLVEQRPEEGTAEELYQQIQAEKQRLIQEKKIKKEKPLPEITEEEKPFEIPESWKWVRLGSVISLLSGQDLASTQYNDTHEGIPYITGASNFLDEKLLINRWTEFGKNIAHKGDLLLTCKGTVGKTHILDEDEVHIARQIMSLSVYIVNLKFIKYLIESNVPALKSKAKSMIPGIERSNVLTLPIPLPPLAEQERIVAKIEELLPLIDCYEAAWSRLEAFNKRFPEDMQKSILQQAIQGKLVEQRPEEGTGEELYQQIQAEKQALIKSKKIKKDKPLPEVTDDEKPFEIPESWKWVKFGEVITLLSGTDFKPDEYNEQGIGIPYITGASSLSENGVIVNRWTESPRIIATNGDVLLVCKGSGYGKTVICDIDEAHIARQIMAIKEFACLNMLFIKYYLEANIKNIKANGQGVIPGIDRGSVLNMAFPLPPLAEQKRIVAKIEQLLPLCERLK